MRTRTQRGCLAIIAACALAPATVLADAADQGVQPDQPIGDESATQQAQPESAETGEQGADQAQQPVEGQMQMRAAPTTTRRELSLYPIRNIPINAHVSRLLPNGCRYYSHIIGNVRARARHSYPLYPAFPQLVGFMPSVQLESRVQCAGRFSQPVARELRSHIWLTETQMESQLEQQAIVPWRAGPRLCRFTPDFNFVVRGQFLSPSGQIVATNVNQSCVVRFPGIGGGPTLRQPLQPLQPN